MLMTKKSPILHFQGSGETDRTTCVHIMNYNKVNFNNF